jgi:hypothetical protein
MFILFLHGWHSVPGGVKPTFLAQHGHTVLNPVLPAANGKQGATTNREVAQAQRELDEAEDEERRAKRKFKRAKAAEDR